MSAVAKVFSVAWRGLRGEKHALRTIRDAEYLFVQAGRVLSRRREQFAWYQTHRFQVSLELAQRAKPRARTAEEEQPRKEIQLTEVQDN